MNGDPMSECPHCDPDHTDPRSHPWGVYVGPCLACAEYIGDDYWRDVAYPTAALAASLDAAIAEGQTRSAEQADLLAAYFDVTCGDCESGRCHWGGQASADSTAAANEGREYHQRCGCDRHEVSARWRNVRDSLPDDQRS